MAEAPSPDLVILLSLWPVTSTLSDHLPAGHLIDLARLSTTLRALLHGFELPSDVSETEPLTSVRADLRIGRHGTPYWQRLKHRAPFECSSRIHTKGPDPKPCRYCSKPVCDACIVRDSFAKGHEYTFHNRVRHLCKTCWETGNPSRTQRFPLTPLNPRGNDTSSTTAEAPASTTNPPPSQSRKWHDPSGKNRDFCTCTLQSDGTLCLDCKDLQNHTSWDTHCHGQNCTNVLSPNDKPLRRICQWCDKPLPRQIGGTTRHHWTSKIIEARARHAASRQADLYEYNRKRLAERTMSRRDLRGDEAVKDDPDADTPQFVRHLDTLNYRSYMRETATPSPDAVFASKRGYWRYSQAFLLAMKNRCSRVLPPPHLAAMQTSHIAANGLRFAATNRQKAEDRFTLTTALPSIQEPRDSQWTIHKATILELLLVQKHSYTEARETMLAEHAFVADVEEYHDVMDVWTTQESIREHRRKSLEDEGETAAENNRKHKNKMAALFGRDAEYIQGRAIDEFDDEGRQNTNNAIEAPPSAPPSQPPLLNSTPLSQTPSTTDPLPPAPPDESTIDPELDALAALYLPISHLADEPPTTNEEPPPYTAGEWEWPGEEDAEDAEEEIPDHEGRPPSP